MTEGLPVALLRLVRRDLLTSHDSELIDFKAFVSSQRYTVDSTAAPASLRPYMSDELIAACAGDCSKFARAALESISGIVTDARAPRNTAWFVVHAYYAAFYSAHALLRLFGVLCSNIDGTEFARLQEAARVTGQTFPQKGFFRINVSTNLNSLTFEPLKNSHEDTWATVISVLDQLRDQAAIADAPKTSRDAAVELLSRHMARLTDDQQFSKGNFLSYARNQVQYRFAYRTWYPYGVKNFPPAASLEEIAVSVLEDRFQEIPGESDLVRFANGALSFCQFTLKIVDTVLAEQTNFSRHLSRDYMRVKNFHH